MPRQARIVVPKSPHHIVQRGNRRMPVFFCDDDYELYIDLMAEFTKRYGVEIWAYCLMTNHVHLMAVPPDEISLTRAIGEAHRRYSAEINRRKRWTGHLWQGRYGSFVMDETYMLAAARYIERNPIEAGMVRVARSYKWSSARAHIEGQDDRLVKVKPLLSLVSDWRDFIGMKNHADDVALIERHEHSGWPLGNEKFLEKIGRKIGRASKPNPCGRPSKAA
jgi:putative transposase